MKIRFLTRTLLLFIALFLAHAPCSHFSFATAQEASSSTSVDTSNQSVSTEAESLFCQGNDCYSLAEASSDSDREDIYSASMIYYKEAAKLGHAEAMFVIGRIYETREEIGLEYVKAFKWFKKAAMQEHAEAQCRLGVFYKDRNGIPKEEENKADQLAVEWYRQAIKQNYVRGMTLLGDMYEKRKGINEEESRQAQETALELYQTAYLLYRTALPTDPFLQNDLAFLYLEKRGISEEEWNQTDDLAFKWFKRAAEQGYESAQNNLGYMYFSKRGISEADKDQADMLAVEWWKKAANNGHPSAQSNLGYMYLNQKGISEREKDKADDLAFKWFKRAAQKEYQDAQVYLGHMYISRQGIPEEVRENADAFAFDCFLKAALKENEEAQVALGQMYVNRQGIPEELKRNADTLAFECFQEAAKKGNIEGQKGLAFMYSTRRGVLNEGKKQGNHLAFQYYLMAAQNGDITAQFNLGILYMDRKGIPDEEIKQADQHAYKWFKKAAEKGDSASQLNLGVLYAEKKGIPQEEKNQADALAFEWYIKAAQQGNIKAQYNLGRRYSDKKGIPKKHKNKVKKLALFWYKKAAKNGHIASQESLGSFYEKKGELDKACYWYIKAAESGDAIAQCNLATMYFFGRSVKQSYKEAERWFRNAAEQSFARGQRELARLYHTEKEGVQQSYEEAIKWSKLAAEQGDLEAIFHLGLLYRDGKGVAQSYERAAELFFKAAEQGNAQSQSALGRLYVKGTGVLQSYEEGERWYIRAAEQGDIIAQFNLGCFYMQGYNEKLTEAQSRSLQKTWLSKSARQGYAEAQDALAVTHLKSEEYISAVEWSYLAAKQGDKHSKILLGISYFTGKGVLKNHEKSLRYLKKKLEDEDSWILKENNRKKLNQIYIHKKNKTKEKNLSSDKEWNRAIYLSLHPLFMNPYRDSAAELLIPEIHYFHQTHPLEYTAKYYKKLAEKGSSKSQVRFGMMCQYGLGISQDHGKAAEWYIEAAQRGDKLAQIFLRWPNKERSFILERPSSSIIWHKILLSFIDKTLTLSSKLWYQHLFSERDVDHSQIELEYIKFKEEKTIEDFEEFHSYGRIINSKMTTEEDFFSWLNETTNLKLENVYITYRLGRMHEYGWGTPQDYQKAFECFKDAAVRGYVPAMKGVAEFYREGREGIVAPSNALAVKWYRYAGKQGDAGASAAIKDIADENFAPAVYALAKVHEEGWGVARDEEETIVQYAQAADLGYYKGQYALALQQLDGKTSLQSERDPLDILSILSGQEARRHYLRTRGRQYGARKERKYFTRLQKQGLPPQGYYRAQHKLADLYEQGRIIPLDTTGHRIMAYREALRLYKFSLGNDLGISDEKDLNASGCLDSSSRASRSSSPESVSIPCVAIKSGTAENNQCLSDERSQEIADTNSQNLFGKIGRSSRFVASAPLERVERLLRNLESMGDEEKFRLDYPGFERFLEKSYASTEKLSNEFKHQLAHVFRQSQSLPDDLQKETRKILRSILRFPENSKQAWGSLTGLKTLILPRQIQVQAVSLEELKTFSRKVALLHPLWCVIPDIRTVPETLQVTPWMLSDPRVDIFNSCFRDFEATFPNTFEGCVQKILRVFDKLHNPVHFPSLCEEKSDVNLTLRKQGLHRLLTHGHDAHIPNRFAHRLVHVSDMLQAAFEISKTRRDMDTLLSLKEMLLHWSVRGDISNGGDCPAGAEDELNRYYIESLLNKNLNTSAALSKEDWTLELQVSVSLTQLRQRLVHSLVTESSDDSNRIHAIKHLEKKVRIPLGLLGDTEHYVDVLEKTTVHPRYIQMTSQDIINEVMKEYTPDAMAAHLANEIGHPRREENVGKNISYEKLLRRLRFQYIRNLLSPHGEYDCGFLLDEDEILDRWTEDDLKKRVLSSGLMASRQNHFLEWEIIKGQAYTYATKTWEDELCGQDYQFTLQGAKTILYAMEYLEEK